jgi:hypothetical protein
VSLFPILERFMRVCQLLSSHLSSKHRRRPSLSLSLSLSTYFDENIRSIDRNIRGVIIVAEPALRQVQRRRRSLLDVGLLVASTPANSQRRRGGDAAHAIQQ